MYLPNSPFSTQPVDVGKIGHVTGCHQTVEELHGLQGGNTSSPQQQSCGDEEHHTLEHHHRLVPQPVGQQEHRHQHSQVGVGPHRENLIIHLTEKHQGESDKCKSMVVCKMGTLLLHS